MNELLALITRMMSERWAFCDARFGDVLAAYASALRASGGAAAAEAATRQGFDARLEVAARM
ncbi:MAG: hypothetical protein K2Q20_13055, partial [Phycisphaerales bacterium]|nr:hypothetical protein [Phycisphaerales bacterium]